MEECLICKSVNVTQSPSHQAYEVTRGHEDGDEGRKVSSSSGLDLLEQETQAYYFLHKLMSLPSDTCARLMRTCHDDDDEVGTFLSSLFDLCGDCRTQYLVEGRRIFDQIQRLRRQHNELKDTILTRMRIKAEVNDEEEEEMILPHEIHPEELSDQAEERKEWTEELRTYLLGEASSPSFLWHSHSQQKSSFGRKKNKLIQTELTLGSVDPYQKQLQLLVPQSRRRTGGGTKKTKVKKVKVKKETEPKERRRRPPPYAKTSEFRTKTIRTLNSLSPAQLKTWIEKKRKLGHSAAHQQRLEDFVNRRLAFLEGKNDPNKSSHTDNSVENETRAELLDFHEESSSTTAMGSSEQEQEYETDNEAKTNSESPLDCEPPKQVYSKTTQWVCHVCDQPLKLGEIREDHVRIEHMDEDSLTCPGCKIIFAKICNYKSHVQKARKEDPNSPCFSLALPCPKAWCQKNGVLRNSEATLEVHNRVVHTDIDPNACSDKARTSLTCPTCQKFFKCKYSLTKHISTHDSPLVKCTYPNCTTFLKGKERLRVHIRLIHEGINNQLTQCPTCGKMLKQRQMRRHKRLHMDTTPFLCSECGKGYKVWDQLRIHMWSHDKTVYREKYDKYKENAKRRKLEAKLKDKRNGNNDNETEQSADVNTNTTPVIEPLEIMETLSSVNDNSTPIR